MTDVRPMLLFEQGQHIPLIEHLEDKLSIAYEAIGDYLITRIIDDTFNDEDLNLIIGFHDGATASYSIIGAMCLSEHQENDY